MLYSSHSMPSESQNEGCSSLWPCTPKVTTGAVSRFSPSFCRLEEISAAVCQAAHKHAVEFQSSKLSALPCSNLYFTDSKSVLVKFILWHTPWLGPSLVDQFALKLSPVWVICSTASFFDISDMYPRHLLFIFNPFTKMGFWWPPAISQQEQLGLARLLSKVSTSSSNFPGSTYHFLGTCSSKTTQNLWRFWNQSLYTWPQQ